jgi:di- and tripeptidase
MKHDKSILALAVSAKNIFAGTQGGEILVYSLDTYERRKVIEAHKGSVLGLCLSPDEALLLSSATDPIVNVRSHCGPGRTDADRADMVYNFLPPPVRPLVDI